MSATRQAPISTQKLFDQEPPSAPEAECALLGSMFIDPGVIGDVLEIVKATDFFKPKNAVVFDAFKLLHEGGIPVDMVHIHQRLKDLDVLENVGGLDYIVFLAESVPSSASALYYATIVAEKSKLRHLIDSAGRILHDAYTTTRPVNEQLDAAEAAILALGEAPKAQDAQPIGAVLDAAYAAMEANEGKPLGIPTGLVDLDEEIVGLAPGNMVVIGGRPASGKTSLMMQIAENIALHDPVGVFSMEMSKEELGWRMACAKAGVDGVRRRRNLLLADEYGRLSGAVGFYANLPMHIDDGGGLTIQQIRHRARRMVSRLGVKALFIDYLQLMGVSGGKSYNRNDEVSEQSRGIKALARELGIPIVVLSQLSRKTEDRDGHRPRMSDLRDSGAIEQDADMILFVHRADAYITDPAAERSGIAEVGIGKNRHGPSGGVVKFQWDQVATRFRPLHTGGFR